MRKLSILVVIFAIGMACTKSAPDTLCQPLGPVLCLCEDGSKGTHECSADGQSFSACANCRSEPTNDASVPPVIDASKPPPVDAAVKDTGGKDVEVVTMNPHPTCDGVIHKNEYGGQGNMATYNGVTWYMTWDAQSLYIGIEQATATEALVLYVDIDPVFGPGSDTDGTDVGRSYDGAQISLPTRADFAAYLKAGYNEYALSDRMNDTWGIPHVGQLGFCNNTSTTREAILDWSDMGASSMPSSFRWLGYIVSASGYVYGQMPPENPSQNVGLMGIGTNYFSIEDTTDTTSPFVDDLTGP